MYERAFEFIAKYEGMHLKAYHDTGGYAICFGNRSYKGEVTTEEDCHDRLIARIKQIETYIENLFPNKTFTDNQKIALISHFYNVKTPKHTIWRISEGQSDKSVANAIRFYTRAGGVELRGLVTRRDEEAKLYLTK